MEKENDELVGARERIIVLRAELEKANDRIHELEAALRLTSEQEKKYKETIGVIVKTVSRYA